MEWFEPGLTLEEAKKKYRALARQWHPDMHVGMPDHEECEEKFKEINDQYARLVKGEVAAQEQWFDEEGMTDELYSRLKLVEQLVTEMFPRIRITYWAYLITPTLEFLDDDVPMYKVMRVVEVAQEILGKAQLVIELHRPCRKKVFRCLWDRLSRTLLVDCESQPANWVPKGSGRRYKEFECLRVERVLDTKDNISYVKTKSPKLDFRKDFLKI